MALFAKDPQSILNESLDFIKSNTAITSTSPGSKFRTLADIVKNNTSEAYTIFDFNVAIGFVYGARGKFLDYLGEIFGLQRRKAATAYIGVDHQIMKFYTNAASFGQINNNADIILPAGSKVWAQQNGQNIYFALDNSVTLTAAKNEQFVAATALQSGTQSNVQSASIVYSEFTGYADFKNNTLLVTNTDSITTGADDESDDNFRFRIINQRMADYSANSTAVRLAALSVDGVADVGIYDKFFGIGSSAVLVKATSPEVSDLLLAEVQVAIDSVKAEGLTIIAMKPEYLRMSFIVTPIFKPNTSTNDILNARDAIKQSIIDYVNNKDVAEPFYLNTLANIILASHFSIESIGQPNKFFDKITLIKTAPNGALIYTEIQGDYFPTDFQKFIMSTDVNAITVN